MYFAEVQPNPQPPKSTRWLKNGVIQWYFSILGDANFSAETHNSWGLITRFCFTWSTICIFTALAACFVKRGGVNGIYTLPAGPTLGSGWFPGESTMASGRQWLWPAHVQYRPTVTNREFSVCNRWFSVCNHCPLKLVKAMVTNRTVTNRTVTDARPFKKIIYIIFLKRGHL